MDKETDIDYKLIKTLFIEFANNKKFMFSLIIIAILSYGFYLINISIGIDELAISNYVKGSYALASGRYTFTLIGWILGFFSYTPFFMEFFCLIILMISLILMNVLLKIYSKDKLPMNSHILFSIMFLSYSIISESLIYQANSICFAFGYLFTTLSVIYTCRYLINNNIKYFFPAIIFLVLALGLYETFLSVYLLLIIISLILKLYYKTCINFRKYTGNIIVIVFYALFSRILLQQYLNFSNVENVANQNVFWLAYSFMDTLKFLYNTFINNVLRQGMLNLPFTILLISFLTYISMAAKLKKKIYILLFSLLFLSSFIIQIIMGAFTYNRTLNSLSIYVSFSFCLLYAITQSSKIRKVIFISVIYLCLLSSKNINNELYKDFKRYNYEKYIINQTAFMLNNEFGYTAKPVVFLGEVNEPFTNDYYSEIGNSSITWSINAFNKGMQETQKLFLEQGHKFNLPTEEQINNAAEIFESMPRFPQTGSIKLINDEYIIVRY